METKPLTTSAISLWHALMHINSNAGWANNFTVSTVILMGKCGLAERTIRAARQELKEKGYIDFKTKIGSRLTYYQMKPLSEPVNKDVKEKKLRVIQAYSEGEGSAGKDVNVHAELDAEEIIFADHHVLGSAEVSAEHHAEDTVVVDPNVELDAENDVTLRATLYKYNNKRNNNLYHTFITQFKREPTPFQLQQIDTFVDQDGLEEELVCYAMKLSGDREKPFKYAVGIMNQWVSKRIRSLEDAKREEQKFYREIKWKKGGEVNEQHATGFAESSSIPADFKFYQ